MALNVAVPLSGVNDLFDGCSLISPIPSISPISPIFGFRDNLQFHISPTSSTTNEVSSNESKDSNIHAPKFTSTPTSFDNINDINPILYNGRNILDLAHNIKSGDWTFQYAYLPENNLQMFLKNRSQYHRLGANGHIQDYAIANCAYCSFIYPTMINQYINVKQTKSESNTSTKNANIQSSYRMYKYF